jgi:erythromycin esterase-like protein
MWNYFEENLFFMGYFGKEAAINENEAISAIQENAHILWDTKSLDPLFKRIGNARIVMLGEASHGTHEYYTWRSKITQRLIKEKGFNFIAVEGDWPDCYRINRYIKNYIDSENSATELLKNFNRWPTWMWANWEIVALMEWLRTYNEHLIAKNKVGFYGLDVYSLWESMQAIIDYLKKVDPIALKFAERAFSCFEPYKGQEGSEYAAASRFVPELCENEVVNLLEEIQQRLPQYDSDYENVFSTEQNSLIAVNAERYYRAMINGGSHSWNVRDKHMQDTLDRLLNFQGSDSKAIVWAHNTHIGDARATDMIANGMYNIGELARQKYKQEDVCLIGFGTYKGNVIAGKSWGSTMKNVVVPSAVKGSWENLLHSAGPENKLLLMEDFTSDLFMENHIGHRAIGVVYNPEYEKYGNYVPSILPLRYDAFIYLDHTQALHPLHIKPDGHQMPETYPFGV